VPTCVPSRSSLSCLARKSRRSWPSRLPRLSLHQACFSASGQSVASVERPSPGDLPVLVAVVYPRRWHEMALPPYRQTPCGDASGIFGGHETQALRAAYLRMIATWDVDATCCQALHFTRRVSLNAYLVLRCGGGLCIAGLDLHIKVSG
jgi:hypothetical protein